MIRQYNEIEIAIFDKVHSLIINDVHYFNISRSFENYYNMMLDGIKYYESIEDYKKAKDFQDNINRYISVIPKNIDEALKYMINAIKEKQLDNILTIDTYTLAINLHHKTGYTISDMWLLNRDISPLRQYIVDNYQLENVDQIINLLLTKYVNAVKSKLELEQK